MPFIAIMDDRNYNQIFGVGNTPQEAIEDAHNEGCQHENFESLETIRATEELVSFVQKNGGWQSRDWWQVVNGVADLCELEN